MTVPFSVGSLISNSDSMILKPFSPKRCAYLFHCNNISVSVNGSVGSVVVGFIYDLLFSSNAFLARILAKEKAETFARLSVALAGLTSFGVSTIFSTGVVCTGIVVVSALSF